MLAVIVVCGCDAKTNVQLYENPEFGISLEKPESWSHNFYERSGSIVLEAKSGPRNGNSARIEIFGYACVPQQFDDPREELEANIERIGILYNLDSVSVTQEPEVRSIEDYEVAEATIMVPTISLPEDSVINQLGNRKSGVFQIIDMLAIRDPSRNSVMVYVYRGNSEELNAEADAIVESIRFICAA